ncbi:tetratricopeptide repeat protein [Aliikangiella marina]|nr:hypothetical protein [Aliikangiella marina]
MTIQYWLSISIAIIVFSSSTSANETTGTLLQKNFKAKNFSAIKTYCQSVKTELSAFQDCLYYLGRINFDSDNTEQAEHFFKKALEYPPNNPDEYYWLARTSSRLASEASFLFAPGYAKTAEKSFQQALALDKNHLPSLIGLQRFYLFAPSIAGGSLKKSLALSHQIKLLDIGEGLLAELSIYQQKEDIKGINAVHQQVLENLPDSINHRLRLVYAYQQVKNYQVVFELLLPIVNIKLNAKESTEWSTSASLSEKLMSLYQVGKTSAISGLQSKMGIYALKTYITYPQQEKLPELYWAKLRIAQIHWREGNSKQAKVILEEIQSKSFVDRQFSKEFKRFSKRLKQNK